MYFTGRRTISYVDTDRNGRKVEVSVWYPAVRPEGFPGTVAQDAAPDLGGAPYPLIVSSTKMANTLAPYLVTHGFTWASVNGLDTYPLMKYQMFSQPLDILFTLDQVASNPPQGLEGVIDADHAGAVGYSFDGYNTLAMSGARIDPQYYLAQCPKPDATTQEILSDMSSFNCAPATEWQDFLSRAGEAITTSDDGLWQPMTDPRIRAVMPMASEGWWVFGEEGLAAVDRPVLIIVGSEDVLYPENELIFEHLGTAEKVLITFSGKGHMMISETKMVARMAHFAAAFFGYHLQRNEDLKYYFSEAWVAQQDGVAWGPYRGD
jgi:predicted dienelactone hydrolase